MMEQIHLVRRKDTKVVRNVYKKHAKALKAAEKLNKDLSWLDKLLAEREFVVTTFNIIE